MSIFKITLLSMVVGVTSSTAFSLWEAYRRASKSEASAENYSDILNQRKNKKTLQKAKERVENEVPRAGYTVVEELEQESGERIKEYVDTIKSGNVPEPGLDDTDVGKLSDIGDEKDLRYDSNSIKAWMQFMNYMLSDFEEDSNIKLIMYKLFDTEFVPADKDDQTIVSRCMDQRLNFFGEDSKYYGDSNISLAEVILDFANRADFDYDHGVPFWTEAIINDLPIDESTSVDELCALSVDIANLEFRQDITKYYLYGLFALRDDEMQAGTEESLMKQFEDWEISYAQNVD